MVIDNRKDGRTAVKKTVLIASLMLLMVGVRAQPPAVSPPAVPPQTAPDIPYDVQDVIKMPENLYIGEVAGVALNSKKHIFIYTRTGADDGSTVLEPRMARLFEYNPDGTFLKELGKNLYSKAWAHAVRID